MIRRVEEDPADEPPRLYRRARYVIAAIAACEFESSAAYYDPPYESPIEDAFAWHLVKHLHPAVALLKQAPAPTICGNFRLDFRATVGGRTIGFECDGPDYHDEVRDECRDALILWSGHADVIYRLRGTDLHHRMNEVLGTLGDHEPALFSERGLRNVRHLSREAIHRRVGSGMILVELAPEEGERRSFPLHIECRTRELRFLSDFDEFAWSRGGGDLDATIRAFVHGGAMDVA